MAGVFAALDLGKAGPLLVISGVLSVVSQLGDLFEKSIRAQHSQGNEREADDYSMQFMKKNKYAPMACVTA